MSTSAGEGPVLPPLVIIVMGVSGSGKTTVGSLLAARLHWSFADADDFHSPANIAKMRNHIALDDASRIPWLQAIARHIDQWRSDGEHGVIACSALKRCYRDIIIGDRSDVRLVYLQGTKELINDRLAGREGHFMAADLLDSQFDVLDEPGADERVITVAIDKPSSVLVDKIIAALAGN